MKDILNIIQQMRKSPPKGKDDPRFDELEDAVSMYGEDEALEGEDLGEDMEADDEVVDEAPIDEDQALMDEAMATDDEDIAVDEAEEDEEDPMAPDFKSKKKKNPLMKKSSYLDM